MLFNLSLCLLIFGAVGAVLCVAEWVVVRFFNLKGE
jgi:hypothetical protein